MAVAMAPGRDGGWEEEGQAGRGCMSRALHPSSASDGAVTTASPSCGELQGTGREYHSGQGGGRERPPRGWGCLCTGELALRTDSVCCQVSSSSVRGGFTANLTGFEPCLI